MSKISKNMFRKIVSSFTLILFIFGSVITPGAFAQSVPSFLNLPAPGAMLTSTAAYNPAVIMGVNIRPEDSLMFDFIIDRADSGLEGEAFNAEANKLIKYFLAALTTPQEQMWVNLSPYESGRIIPEVFGRTEMGRDMLAQDYILKQLSASLLSPEEALGEEFWRRFQTKAQEQFGSSDIPLSVFNKIWIVPETASIYEHSRGAYIVDSHLNVMLEQDYLALDINRDSTVHGLGTVSDADLDQITGTAANIIREVLLPEIEREVNQGRLFAPLRQIMHSMLLAKWYKDNLKESLLGQVYADKGKTNGVDSDPASNQQIYNAYLKAFETGAYNYVKEEYDPTSQSVIPKKYFSGGVAGEHLTYRRNAVSDFATLGKSKDKAVLVTAAVDANAAMTVDEIQRIISEAYDVVDYFRELSPQQLSNLETALDGITDYLLNLSLDQIVQIEEKLQFLKRKFEKKEIYRSLLQKLDDAINKLLDEITVYKFSIIKSALENGEWEDDGSDNDNLTLIAFLDPYISNSRNPKIIKLAKDIISLLPSSPDKAMAMTGNEQITKPNPIKELWGNILRDISTADVEKDDSLALENLLNEAINDGTPGSIQLSTGERIEVTVQDDAPTRTITVFVNNFQVATKTFDLAMTTNTPHVKGGIDFNPDAVKMNVFNDGEGFTVIPPSMAEIEQFMNNNGFEPLIINVQPVTSLPLLLGLKEEEGQNQISRL